MPEAISNNLSPMTPLKIGGPLKQEGGATVGDDFASMVKQQLAKVNQMQTEADDNVQKLLTGQTENMTEVFVAARKAQVAFSLLMEIRNKLIDAYQEVKNMRV